MNDDGKAGTDMVTLSRYLLSEHQDPDIVVLMNSIQLACKYIAMAVRKAGIAGLYGLDGSTNATGDDVKKLDMLSNDVFINALKNSRELAVMVSEENPDAIIVEEKFRGKYCIAFDPLDGSSNIDCNVSTGTIFGIYKKASEGEGSVNDILLPGNSLVAAGYCLYGSSTEMVITWGNGVDIFSLDPSLGEFILTNAKVKIPEKPKTIYSCNEGNYVLWDDQTKAYVEQCKNAKKPYSARYIGSMVADVHRTLLYGGIFFYPADTKNKNGKLRLLYEAAPMSMIMEQAGGKSTTGTERVMDIVPTQIHERCPIYIGCTRDVEAVEALYKESVVKEPPTKKQCK
jgi:fructose-1,6-bisphosphatase I